MEPSAATICGAARDGRKLPGGGCAKPRGSSPATASRLTNSSRRSAPSGRCLPRMSRPSGPTMNRSRSPIEYLLASSQTFKALTPPRARTSEACMATAGRRGSSCGSYSCSAIVKVVAMLPPTISAIASQKSTKILKYRLCMRERDLTLRPCQRISRSAHILDFRILAGWKVHFAAQIADVGVDAAIVSGELAAERLLGHRVTRDHLACRAHQQFEHAKFGAGESNRPLRDTHLTGAGMQDDRPHGQFVGHAAAAGAAVGATQNRANSRHQFPRVERFAEIIIGAQLEAHDPVDIIAAGGEHQDRRFVGSAECAQNIEAADAWQHDVQNHDFKVVGLQFRESVAAVVHAFYVEVFRIQIFGQHLA